MKKIISSLLLLTIATGTFAKKVKFAVDMTNETISPNGIHVTGDFQTLAGFPGGDWASNTTPLTQEGATAIYSIVVDIPAFAKYEYKYVNGDQFYEAEFIPVESRVGYNFNDNRWLYLDSLADDTTYIGALVFAANAPMGMTLVRFLVNMQNETISANGVHVAGDFQGWNPETNILYSFGSNIFEGIAYVNTGTIAYKYYNGNTAGDNEIVPAICSVNSNRELNVTGDIVLSEVCYAACTACTVGMKEVNETKSISLSPNPSRSFCNLEIKDSAVSHNIILTDVTSRLVRTYENHTPSTLIIFKDNLKPGVYFVTVTNEQQAISTSKLIIE
jgi:hypothetical protein